MISRKRRVAAEVLLAVGVLALHMVLSPQRLGAEPPVDEAPILLRGSEGVRLPPEMAAKLGIATAEARPRAAAARARVLRLPGSVGLDPARLMRIRVRFAPAEVVEIGQVAEPPDRTRDARRELRPGDAVKKGDLLASFSSAEAAARKNDLFDAVVQLALDEEVLDKVEKAAGSVPEVVLLNARRTVVADQSAITRARQSLLIQGIPEKEIDAVRQAAREASKRKGKPETEEARKARESAWKRVEVTAPEDGTIIERNVTRHEVIADSPVIIFQIANLDRLLVLAQVPEEDLPALMALKPAQRRWVIRIAADPDGLALPGLIDDIGYLIDPTQHTAVIRGHIDNGEHRLRPGQYVTASIVLPAAAETVLPASAVVEEGRKTFIFIQPDAKKPYYEQRRVLVVRRGQDQVHVASALTPDQERQGYQLVRPGERVVTAGAIELRGLVEDLKAAEER
jgi:cobalt-zinc-cadmium efflux system membrane fusion protein